MTCSLTLLIRVRVLLNPQIRLQLVRLNIQRHNEKENDLHITSTLNLLICAQTLANVQTALLNHELLTVAAINYVLLH